MTEYIYGDILFIINFSMDFLSLFITGKIMHFRMGVWRMILAASIGGIYGVASLFISAGTVGGILLDISVALIMCAVAHYHGSFPKTAASTALFYAVSMLMGGVMTAIYTKIGIYKSYLETGGSISTVFGEMDIWVFCLLAALSAGVTFFLQKAVHMRSRGKFCRIRVLLGGKTYELSGFFDSGNSASEPISGAPVVFISSSASRRLEKTSGKPLFCVSGEISEEDAGKIRFIPVNTVAGYTLAAAIRPEKFEIMIKHAYEERDALICADENAGDYSGADALVPLSLI
ncbi:MAG: sigma-E processing peptidase SpoIIGA [Eubacteriales bacterium]